MKLWLIIEVLYIPQRRIMILNLSLTRNLIVGLLMGPIWLVSCAAPRSTDSHRLNHSRMEAFFQRCLGTPYKLGGITPGRGLDCSGLTYLAYLDQGIVLPSTSSEQYQVGKPIAKDQLQYGDLVFFNTNGKGVSHVGIYIGQNQMIHASASRGVIRSSLDNPYWRERYVGARRIIGTPYEVGPPLAARKSPNGMVSNPMRRLVTVPTTAVVGSKVLALDLQTGIQGDLRLTTAVGFARHLEIGFELQLEHFLGTTDAKVERVFGYVKVKFWGARYNYPGLAMGMETSQWKWIVKDITFEESDPIIQWSPPRNAYLVLDYAYQRVRHTRLGRGKLILGVAATDLFSPYDSSASAADKVDLYWFWGVSQHLSSGFSALLEMDYLNIATYDPTLNAGLHWDLNRGSSLEYLWFKIGTAKHRQIRCLRFTYTLPF